MIFSKKSPDKVLSREIGIINLDSSEGKGTHSIFYSIKSTISIKDIQLLQLENYFLTR